MSEQPELIRDQWFGSIPGREDLGPFVVPAFVGDRALPESTYPCCAHCTHLELAVHNRPCRRCT